MGERVIVLLLITSVVFGAPPSNSPNELLRKSNELFAIKLYQKISHGDGNILLSPFSLQTALGLLQLGSKGQTLNEISETLAFSTQKSDIEQAFKDLLPTLSNLKFATLTSATKLFVKDGFDISPNFTNIAREAFDADIETVNFSDGTKTVDDINGWVKSKTENKIQQIINEGMISPFTQLVLLNAFYFNGRWEEPFNRNLTSRKTFHANKTHTAVVDMMRNHAFCKYREDRVLDAKILVLPYARNEFTMTFIVPNKFGLIELEDKLSEILQEEIFSETVNYFIPRFKLEETNNYKQILEELGMTEVFTEKADLSDITKKKQDLSVSDIVQKNYIYVSEDGTEAAGASGILFETRTASNSPTFRADRPFIFVLRHTDTGIIHLMGRYANPENNLYDQNNLDNDPNNFLFN